MAPLTVNRRHYTTHLERAVKPGAVICADEPISEHAALFMAPESEELVLVIGVLGFDHQHSLEHLRQISQVECVVALCWSRQQFTCNPLVYLNGRGYERLRQGQQGGDGFREEASKDSLRQHTQYRGFEVEGRECVA